MHTTINFYFHGLYLRAHNVFIVYRFFSRCVWLTNTKLDKQFYISQLKYLSRSHRRPRRAWKRNILLIIGIYSRMVSRSRADDNWSRPAELAACHTHLKPWVISYKFINKIKTQEQEKIKTKKKKLRNDYKYR
jgi:hypothetical protein